MQSGITHIEIKNTWWSRRAWRTRKTRISWRALEEKRKVICRMQIRNLNLAKAVFSNIIHFLERSGSEFRLLFKASSYCCLLLSDKLVSRAVTLLIQ